MKYWFDTEFIDNGKTIDLLSIGIVAEDGRELYLCNQDAKLNNATEWVIWNVYPSLGVKHGLEWYWDAPVVDVDSPATSKSRVVPHHAIRDRVRVFVGADPPEFWGYYADYDWVVLCQLFGRMVDLPKGWPMYCRDLKQLCDDLGNPELPRQCNTHHALDDARWIREMYLFLSSRRP